MVDDSGLPPSPPSLTVLTYNVRYANPNDAEQVWENRRDDVASCIRFHRPQLVGLQEAAPEQVRDLSERLPAFEWLTGGRSESENAGEYVAIGYDADYLDAESEDEFWLSETPSEPGSRGWDAMLPRLVRYSRFRDRRTDDVFYHFNTHFDHRGETARLESARLLRDRIDDVAAETPFVVTGDFNARPSTDVYRTLTAEREHGRALVDAHYRSDIPHHGPLTTMTDFHDLVPEKKIDYVFVSEELDVNVHGTCSDLDEEGQYPSDHLPILTVVQYNHTA
ncbi:endonuclease/exonuclease/phosphatase family protein [Halobacterium zhouii]|uniref:endonuclease/exonuclease/phosphatase family protein n=1 Tax=Halobacterium zhouii TaxID=2902624 RepID=UPI001E40026A|nr:endonuclease/exonuclease/phosphatase family protein [Halobacterium zhouii]